MTVRQDNRAGRQSGPDRSSFIQYESGTTRGSIQHLVAPRSVAIFGVSASHENWATKALNHSLRNGYSGEIYGVNPNAATTRRGEVPIVPNLSSIDTPIDCALIAVGRDRVLDALTQCAEYKVRNAVIVAAGFGELGDDGRHLESEMLSVASKSGTRILGPNCIGLFRKSGVCFTPFSLPAGDVGLISQSGNVAISLGMKGQQHGFGFSACVGMGNQVDISIGEVLRWFATDSATSCVAIYLEGVPSRGTTDLLDGLNRCRAAGKSVFVLRGGTSERGSATAGTHTGSLAGDGRVWSAILEATGSFLVNSESELVDVLLASTLPKFMGGVVVITDGGGNSVMAIDALSRHGLSLANLSLDTQKALQPLLPPLAPRHEGLNPLTMDTPGGLQDDPGLLATTAEVCAQDPNVGAIVIAGLFGGFRDHRVAEHRAADRLLELRQSGLPVAVASAYSGVDEEVLSGLRARGIPVYGCVDRLAAGLSVRHEGPGTRRTFLARQSPNGSMGPPPHARKRHWLRTGEARRRLASVGIQCPEMLAVSSKQELQAAIATIGLPMVLKVESEEVVHKSDVGGVKLALSSDMAAIDAAGELWEKFPGTTLIAMPMLAPGLELLVGMSWDPIFGSVVTVGRGGIWAEAEDDVVVLPTCIADFDLPTKIEGLRCYPMMAGSRGQPPLDVRSVSGLVARLFELSRDGSEPELDLNPVLLYQSGLAVADLRMSVRNRDG